MKNTTDRIASDFNRALEIITSQPRCPRCGGEEYNKRHHRGSALAPEGSWRECDDCGHASEPS